MKTYRLGSSPLVHTPGLVQYLRVAVKTQKRWAYKVVRDGWGIPTPAIRKLLLGPEPTVEGDVVLVEVP